MMGGSRSVVAGEEVTYNRGGGHGGAAKDFERFERGEENKEGGIGQSELV
jgi:hypothetical protein